MFKIFKQLRRQTCSFSSRSSQSFMIYYHHTNPKTPSSQTQISSFHLINIFPICPTSKFILCSYSLRSFCTHFPTQNSDHDELTLSSESLLGIDNSYSGLINASNVGGDDYILPVRAVMSILGGIHDFTGLPWWLVIGSSTLALRFALFPVLVLQLKKMKIISDIFPKLPPPFPPPLSGRSYMKQLSLFQKERKTLSCPSYLWFLAYFSVQVPCFFLWMFTIRRMSLDHYPGFSYGGALWFQNLTELSHGLFGPIFPFVIAGLHYTNVQLSFRTNSVKIMPGALGLLAKYYKFYLDLLTIPTFFIGFCIPNGSLIYWQTNATLTVIQQLCLRNPAIRMRLGLPENPKEIARESDDLKGISLPCTESLDPLKTRRKISIQNLSPQELLALSVKYLAEGKNDRPIPLLRLALEKDPEYIRALVLLGQTLIQNGLLAEANKNLDCAISKLNIIDNQMDVEKVDLLILASQWAGVSCIRQGKNAEGIIHLQRVAGLNEPEEQTSKAHYYDGLLLLSSALFNEGHKDEAAKLLRMLVAYNPSYIKFLEQCEQDDDTFVSDLNNSRRADNYRRRE